MTELLTTKFTKQSMELLEHISGNYGLTHLSREMGTCTYILLGHYTTQQYARNLMEVIQLVPQK